MTLSNAGYDVYLIVADGLGNEVKDGVKILDVGLKETSRLKRMISTTKKVYSKALELNADLYQFHDPELIPSGVKLKKKTNAVVIFDSHENYADDIKDKPYFNLFMKKMVSELYACYEKVSVRKLSAVIAATPSIRKHFSLLGVFSLDINNYPFEDEFKPIKRNTKGEYSAVYIGSASKVRGIKELVDSLNTNKELKLAIAGGFSEPSFEDELRSSPGWKNVEFMGLLDREKVKELLTKSNVAIVTFLPAPNHIESQPNKMFEYMSAGIPVVASNFPLWKEIIEDNDCGICVDPTSSEEIANAISYLNDNKEVAANMGINGRKAVLDKYNWTAESKKLLDLYSDMLGYQA